MLRPFDSQTRPPVVVANGRNVVFVHGGRQCIWRGNSRGNCHARVGTLRISFHKAVAERDIAIWNMKYFTRHLVCFVQILVPYLFQPVHCPGRRLEQMHDDIAGVDQYPVRSVTGRSLQCAIYQAPPTSTLDALRRRSAASWSPSRRATQQ
jgi:hypothetical protein